VSSESSANTAANGDATILVNSSDIKGKVTSATESGADKAKDVTSTSVKTASAVKSNTEAKAASAKPEVNASAQSTSEVKASATKQ